MRFRLIAAFWGAPFCDLFLQLAARSLLADGNFGFLSRRYPTCLTVLTTSDNIERLNESEIFAALRDSGRVDVWPFSLNEIDPNIPTSHWPLWSKGIEVAKAADEYVIYIMPDTIYAAGALADWANALKAGYKAIFTAPLQVTLESILPELTQEHPISRGIALAMSARELTLMSLRHFHPYHMCLLRNSTRCVEHPESVGYVVRGHGFAHRVMASHPRCFHASFFALDNTFTPRDRFEKVAFLPPDTMSAEPLLKFLPLHYRPWAMTGRQLSCLGPWFDRFVGPINDIESRFTYIWPNQARAAPGEFTRAVAAGEFYRTQCIATRAIYRLWQKLVELGCQRAAAILATGHYAGRLRRHKLFVPPVTVLVPSNEALASLSERWLEGDQRTREQRLRDLVYSHCFPGHYSLPQGGMVSLSVDDELVLDGGNTRGKVLSGPHDVDGFRLYVVNFVLADRNGLRKCLATDSRRLRGDSEGSRRVLLHPSLTDETQDVRRQAPSPVDERLCAAPQKRGLSAPVKEQLRAWLRQP